MDVKKIESNGKARLVRSKKHLKKYSANWDSNKMLMMGRLSRAGRNGIAEAYGIFRSLVSNILTAVPGVYFEAKREEFRQVAGFLTDAVNYDFRIGNLQDRMVKALWQTFPYGYGAISEDVLTDHNRDKNGEIIGIKTQRFLWKNIPPRDVLFDPDGFNTDLSDHRDCWIAHYKSIKELRDDKTYFDLKEIENLPAANETTRDKGEQSASSSGPPLERATGEGSEGPNPDFHQLKLWRWYDRVNEKVSDFLDADGRCVRSEDWPLKVKVQGVLQFPVKLLAMNTEADDFYPIPEVDLLRPQLMNLARLNDQMMTDLTNKIRKYIGLSPYLDTAKLGKLLDEKSPDKFTITGNIDIAALQAGAPKVDSAADCIAKLEDIMADPQLPHGMQEIRAQMSNIAAYGQPSRGGLPQIRSAKEASRVADQVNRSLLSRQSPLEQMTVELAQYHVQMLKLAAPDDMERYAPTSDKLAAMKTWLTFLPNQIPDEKDLFCDVYPGSSTPQNLDGKKAAFLEEMRVMSPILAQEKFSLLPLLYRYADIFNVKYFDQLVKNQKGAAMEALAATVRAGQLGKNAPPDLLINSFGKLIDAVLSPSEKQLVVQAMQQEGQQGGGGGAPNTGQIASPSPTMGTQDGAASA